MWFSSRLQPWLQRRRELKRMGPPEREEAELGGRLPSPAGRELILRTAVPRPAPYTGSASAHVQCSHQRGFQTCRCLFIRYLLLLALLESLHLADGDSADPFCGKEAVSVRTWEAVKRTCPVQWSSHTSIWETFWWRLHRILVGAEEWASALQKRFLLQRDCPCWGGWGRRQGELKKQQQFSVLTPSRLHSFLLCDYPMFSLWLWCCSAHVATSIRVAEWTVSE